MSQLLGADGRPIEEGSGIETAFVWASLSTTQKEILLQSLSDAIEMQIREAIKERIRTSFDADRFRKMGEKDVFMIQMVLRVPVSLIQRILKEFDDGVKEAGAEIPESAEGGGGIGQAQGEEATDQSQSQQAVLPPLQGTGHDSPEGSAQ